MAIKRMKQKAHVACRQGSGIAVKDKSLWKESCKERAEQGLFDCHEGCLGAGDCISVCKFGAIKIGEKGAAEVIYEKCKGCGMCVKACPQSLIELAPEINYFFVSCSNCDKGPLARKSCSSSCIACGICERNCPADAISVRDNCAYINQELCIACGRCASLCPRSAIRDLQHIFA